MFKYYYFQNCNFWYFICTICITKTN